MVCCRIRRSQVERSDEVSGRILDCVRRPGLRTNFESGSFKGFDGRELVLVIFDCFSLDGTFFVLFRGFLATGREELLGRFGGGGKWPNGHWTETSGSSHDW
jgi:hypothetical protein